jgi:hypothetical protein
MIGELGCVRPGGTIAEARPMGMTDGQLVIS